MPKTTSSKMTSEKQLAAFQRAARDVETDDDPERFKETVRKLAKAPPAPGASKALRKGAAKDCP